MNDKRNEDTPRASAVPIARAMDWEGPMLAKIIGQQALSHPESSAWNEERFFEFLRARAAAEASREGEDGDFRDGEAMRERILLRQLRAARDRTAAPTRQASIAGTIQQVRALARSERAIPCLDLGIAAGEGRALWDEQVDTWLDLPVDMPDGDYLALRIVGDSMAPVMHTNDTVLVRLGGDVRADTMIVARQPDDGYVCKAVQQVTEYEITLRSLAPGRPPIVIPQGEDLVLGTVLMIWCEHGT